jgi:hypothetical protein
MEETVLLDERNVRITTAKAQMNGTTYPMAGITSVRTRRESPSMFLPMLLMLGGLCLLFGAFITGSWAFLSFQEGALDPRPVGMCLVGGGLGLGLMMLGAQTSRGAKGRHFVVLGTAGGDRQALSTYDHGFAVAVRQAIEDAITRRG